MELFVDINIIRWLLSVVVLALLLGGLAILAPHIGMKRNHYLRHGRKRRIKLIEAMPLDAKRKVIVFRVGDIEHSLLIGPHEDIHLAAEPVEESEESTVEEDLPIGFLKRWSSETEVAEAKKTKTGKGKKNG